MAAVISVIATANGKETDGSPVVFSFSRTGDTNTALSVSYQLFGTAQAGSDYTGNTTGTINFAAGSSTATLSLPALADGALIDPYETIIARIDPSGSYSITPGKQFATATITAEGMVVIPKGGSYQGKSSGEQRNHYSFAALKNDGRVISWGHSITGSAPVGLTGVSQICSSGAAFAALKSDGSVVSWGHSIAGSAPLGLTGVSQIFSTNNAFAALKNDGTVISWGGDSNGGAITAPAGLTGVSQIFSTSSAFAALKNDGSVISWGDSSYGGVAPAGLTGVNQIFSTESAFAALKNDGSVISWGNTSKGGAAPAGLTGVSQIFSTESAFAALKSDGSIISWGDSSFGGNAPAGLTGVSQIFSNSGNFAVLKFDGSVIGWGNFGTAPAGLTGVRQIFSTRYAFAALKSDGSVVSWGANWTGSIAPAGLTGVNHIFSTGEAFAALKNDGSVVSWGSDSNGGAVIAPAGLTGVSQIFSTGSAFAALKSDGSVIAWGDSDRGGIAPTGLTGVVGFANPYTDDRLVIAPPPTYTLTPSSATINEGAVLTSTVTTTNVATGTKLYYALSGTGISTADFSTGALTGEGTTDSAGKFSFTHTLANDLTTEGAETLFIKLYSDAALTLQVGSTASVTVKDTSIPVIRGNSLYNIVDGPSWTEAEANSVKLGGHLVTINDISENSYLLKGPNRAINALSGDGFYWLGIQDADDDSIYTWSSGQQTGYNSWFADEPSGIDIYGPEYYGFTINFWDGDLSESKNGYWYDTTLDGNGNIPKGISETPFIRRGDSAYVIVQGPTWEEAEANAVKLGGHLVTINGATENEWISAAFGGNSLSGISGGFIGLKELEEGNWNWVDGSSSMYRHWFYDTNIPWNPQEPNNNQGKNEQYGIIYFHSNPGNTGGTIPPLGWWSDGLTNSAIYGIAEIKLAPNNTPTGTPTFTGIFKAGQVISIDKTPVQDADNFTGYTPVFNYSFEVSNDNGSTWTKLTTTDATDNNSTYTLTTAEVGKQVRGVVSYVDGYGTNEVVNSLESTVIQQLEKGPSGRHLSFNGNSYGDPWNYVVVNDSPSLSITGEFTVSAWVYRLNAGGDWRNLYDIPNAHLLEFSPEGGFDWRGENNNTDFNINGPAVLEAEWHHIAATMSQEEAGGYTANVYLDGQLANSEQNWQMGAFSNSSGIRDSDQNLYIGILWSQRFGNPDPWAGKIDDFKIWNIGLSSAEIQSVAESDFTIRRESLVAEYRFNNDFGATILDSSGSQNNGLLVNSQNPKPELSNLRGNSIYQVVQGPTWTEAENQSVAIGGHLATINDLEESNYISDKFNRYYAPYIGLTDEGSEGNWRWISGQNLSWLNWALGTPNGGYSENYSMFYPQAGGVWDDFRNSDPWGQPGIAEIPLSGIITREGEVKEGAGVFTTSINLSAGSSTNLANGITAYWEVSGITADDLATGALTGSGVITNGKLDIQHSLVQDADIGEKFKVSVFSEAERTQQILYGPTKGAFISAVAEASGYTGPAGIRGNSVYLTVAGPTWTEAESQSNLLGGHLTAITSEAENAWITSKFNRSGDLNIQNWYKGWIGLKNFDGGTRHEWTTGESYSFSSWHPGRPAQGSFTYINAPQTDVNFSPTINSGVWVDFDNMHPSQTDTELFGIAEIPLNLSITRLATPKEGAGVFTTSINLSAGSNTNLANGITAYWKVSGITADDLATGALTGSGVITNGKLDLQHSLKADSDTGEKFEVSIYSDADRAQQIGTTTSVEVVETVSTTLTDLEAPYLEALWFNSVIDEPTGNIVFTAYAKVRDNLAGVTFGHGLTHLRMSSPSGAHSVYAAFNKLESGTFNDGLISATFAIPKYAEAGEWSVNMWGDSPRLVDVAGNSRIYSADQLRAIGISPTFGVSQSVNNPPTGTPTVTGTLKVGSTLTIDATAIKDSDNFTGYTPTLKYNWETSTDGTTWSKLTSTDAADNNNTYILTAAETNKKIRGVVNYLDGYGTTEAVNSAGSVAIALSELPVQQLSLAAPSPVRIRSGVSTTSAITYNVSTGETALTGIEASLYFDSTQLTLNTAGDPFKTGLLGNAITTDITNADGDPKTDKVLSLIYTDFGGNFPGSGTTLPLTLANLNLVPTSAYSGTTLHLQGTPAVGYTATGADLTLTYNAAPTVTGTLTSQTINRGSAFTYTVPSGLFTDQDSTLSISAKTATGAALPSWLTFNATTGTFTGTPTAAGTFNLAVVAADELGSVSAPLSLNVREIQSISSSSSDIRYQRNKDVTVPINYNTSDGSQTTGLSFKVHYNSALFSFDPLTGVSNKATADLFQIGAVQSDTSDNDADANTDKFIPINVASFSGSFPSGATPIKLADLIFKAADKAVDPLTGLKVTKINFSITEAAQGYGFQATGASLKPMSFSLDVDGDGKVTALGDGLMVIRKLFGAAFAGDALTSKAISPTATRTTAEIHDFIQQGIDGGLLDVDKDGKTTALGDGLMVIRRLFGAAFAGSALIDKAISPSSPYLGGMTYASMTADQKLAASGLVSANIDAMRQI